MPLRPDWFKTHFGQEEPRFKDVKDMFEVTTPHAQCKPSRRSAWSDYASMTLSILQLHDDGDGTVIKSKANEKQYRAGVFSRPSLAELRETGWLLAFGSFSR